MPLWPILIFDKGDKDSGKRTVISINGVGGFPGGSVVKNLPAKGGDTGLTPDLGRPTCHSATKPVCHNY